MERYMLCCILIMCQIEIILLLERKIYYCFFPIFEVFQLPKSLKDDLKQPFIHDLICYILSFKCAKICRNSFTVCFSLVLHENLLYMLLRSDQFIFVAAYAFLFQIKHPISYFICILGKSLHNMHQYFFCHIKRKSPTVIIFSTAVLEVSVYRACQAPAKRKCPLKVLCELFYRHLVLFCFLRPPYILTVLKLYWCI